MNFLDDFNLGSDLCGIDGWLSSLWMAACGAVGSVFSPSAFPLSNGRAVSKE